MNARTIVALGALLLALLGQASPPPRVGESLQSNRIRSVMRSVRELPIPLRAALARAFLQEKLYLGDPNQPLGEELSVAGRKNFPDRRLIFAFATETYYVVYIEYSPPAMHAAVMIFDARRESFPRLVWGAVDLNESYATTPRQLIGRILAGKVKEPRTVIW